MERLQEIEARKLEIKTMLESDSDADLDAVQRELDSLDEEYRTLTAKLEEERKATEEAEERKKAEQEAETRRKDAEAIEKGKALANVLEKEKEMENVITRDSKQYIDAYAEYVKTGKEDEVRSLLTENVSGTIAVPTMVWDEVKHAWENEGIVALVRKVELKGNLKVNFEISSTGAVTHTEGSGAVSEEELVEGIVTLVPVYRKKWLSVSDEVLAMRGEAFLQYVIAEIVHKIAKKIADDLVAMIIALPQTATSTSVSANKVTMAPALGTIANAIANLSDEATSPVIVMNKLTYATFKEAQYDGNFGVDVFEGLRVIFNNSLPAYASADAGDIYAFVGDLGEGALANFPNGIGNIETVVDTMSRKKEDLVEILGKEYVGLGLVADKAFALLAKPTQV